MNIDKAKALARATELHQRVLSDRPMAEAVMHLCQIVAELEQEAASWKFCYEAACDPEERGEK